MKAVNLIRVVLTGGRHGLGGALCEVLKSAPLTLTVIGREAPLNLGEANEFVKLDLLSNEVANWRYNIKANTTRVIFISNAGIIEPIGQTSLLSQQSLRASYSVNVLAPLLIASELTRKTASRNIDLLIANVSSGAGSKAVPNWASYCSSKAAAKLALDCLALENNHVSVMHIDPGVMDTAMQDAIRKAQKELSVSTDKISMQDKKKELRNPKVVADQIVNIVLGEMT